MVVRPAMVLAPLPALFARAPEQFSFVPEQPTQAPRGIEGLFFEQPLTFNQNIFTITNMYSQIFAKHAQLLKAMAHPKRLEIIHLLRDQEISVSEIHTMLDLPQANISQHLMILRDAGIVSTRKDGKSIHYSLAHPNIIKASDLLRESLIDLHASSITPEETKLSMKELVPLVHDPVCHMRLSPKTAAFFEKHNNQNYYFCASGCLKAFRKDPKKYA